MLPKTLKKNGRPVPVDALDAMDDPSFLENLDGWTVQDMSHTIGRMIRGGDNIARCLANGAETLTERYTTDAPAEPADIEKLSKALQAIGKAIESYSIIFGWATAQGRTGPDRSNSLEELLPLLSLDEMSQLRNWMARMEPVDAAE